MGTEALRFLLMFFAGWVHRGQLEAIGYLKEENRVLREALGGRRLRFTDDQCRRLAAKGWPLGRRRLEQLAGLVTPETLLRWYRELKYDGSARRGAGRPTSAASVQQLVVRFASENPSWGYTRIRGALRNLGHELGRNTIKRILLDNGMAPAPARRKRIPRLVPKLIRVENQGFFTCSDSPRAAAPIARQAMMASLWGRRRCASY